MIFFSNTIQCYVLQYLVQNLLHIRLNAGHNRRHFGSLDQVMFRKGMEKARFAQFFDQKIQQKKNCRRFPLALKKVILYLAKDHFPRPFAFPLSPLFREMFDIKVMQC